PGAGKSTFFEQRFSRTHFHSSKDDLRRRRLPLGRQLELLRGRLAAQQSVVVDDTNLTREQRAGLIAEGQRLGARVVAYFFDCQVGECVARNRERSGRARIPDPAIFAGAKRLQPPSSDEGFDEIRVVRVLPGGDFELSQ
ncbi:MAG TPA: AAA family ATPase, partial [Polyangiaceae bacterium]|nr:AAA family ATPase [Polyangiaceae bacterium]